MEKLPVAVRAKFFDYFTLDERAKLRAVCKSFKEAIEYNLKQVTHLSFQEPLFANGSSEENICGVKFIKVAHKCPSDFDSSLWLFLDCYCGRQIEIQAGNLDLEIDQLELISSKLKFIHCNGIISSSEEKSGELYDRFPQWEGFRLTTMYGEFTVHCLLAYQSLPLSMCNSLLAKNRMNRGQKAVHLVIPCRHLDECETDLTDLPIGLERLELNCLGKKPHPPIKEEVASSLVELRIDGLPELSKFQSKNFSSLKKLILNMKHMFDPKVVPGLLEMFRDVMKQLTSFTFVGSVTAKVEQQMIDLLSLGDALDSIDLKLKNYAFGLSNDGENVVDQSAKLSEEVVITVNWPITKLRELRVDTFSKVSFVQVSTKKLRHLDISADSIVAFNVDCSELTYFKLSNCKVDCDFTNLSVTRNLRFFALKHSNLDYESSERIMKDLKNNKRLEQIEVINLYGMHNVDLKNNPETIQCENGMTMQRLSRSEPNVKATFQLNFWDFPCLKHLQSDNPLLEVVLDNNIESLVFEYKVHDRMEGPIAYCSLKRPDGVECVLADISLNPPPVTFDEPTTNLLYLDVSVGYITEGLLTLLEQHCQHILMVNVTEFFGYEYLSDFKLKDRWTKWLKSLQHLQVVVGFFSQAQLVDLFSTLQAQRFSLLITTFIEERSKPLDDQLHAMLLDKIKSGVLLKYDLPWKCSCQEGCPLNVQP